MAFALGGIDVKEGLFNPKTVGTDQRVTQGLSPQGQQYGQGAVEAQRQAMAGYQGIADGSAPSIAQMQMQQAMEMNNRQAMGLMGQSRGGNVAGAYQQALGAQQGANVQAAGQGAMLRAQEQQMAYAGMGQLAGQMAGQQFGYDQLNQQSQLGLRGQDLDYNLGKRGLDQERQAQRFGQNMQLAQAGAGAVGGVFGSMVGSDVRLKQDMGPASVASAAAEIDGLGYQYKPGAGPDGRQLGVSADQVAQTSLGPTLVQRGDDGMLQLDGGRAGVAGLAASGENARRIAQLEQQLMQREGYGSLQMGQERQREAERLTNEMAAMRGLAQVHRGQMEGPQPYAFGDPQILRGSDPNASVDPFSDQRAFDAYLAGQPPASSVSSYGFGEPQIIRGQVPDSEMFRGYDFGVEPGLGPMAGGGEAEMASLGITDRNMMAANRRATIRNPTSMRGLG